MAFADKEKERAYKKAWYLANRESVLAKLKAYYASSRESVKTRVRAHAAKNSAVNAAKAKLRRERNIEAVKIRAKKYYDRTYHHGQREKYLERVARRKALKVNTKTARIDYRQILLDANGICGICRKPLDLFGVEFDHVVPLSRGGTHTRENIQASHARCNRSKGAKVAA